MSVEPGEVVAEQHLRVGVVLVHVRDDPGGRVGERIGLGPLVGGGVDPAHASVPADVADVVDGEPQEREVAEVDVVRRRGVRLEVAGAGDVAVVVGDRREQAEQGDASARQRICTLGDRLGEEQAGAWVVQRVQRT